MLTQTDAAGRNYPALFLALDDVLEAVEDGRPDEVALQRSFEDSADAFGADKALFLMVVERGPLRLRAVAARGLSAQEVSAAEGAFPSRGSARRASARRCRKARP